MFGKYAAHHRHESNDVRIYHTNMRSIEAEDHVTSTIATHKPHEVAAPFKKEHLSGFPVVGSNSNMKDQVEVEKKEEAIQSEEPPMSKDKYAELYEKYNEDCVKLGNGHLEELFLKKGACFSRKRVQEILIDLVFNVSKVFTDHGITNFLDSGTYLGAVRHKSIIPFDQDADIGIDQVGYEKIRDNPIQFPAEYYMQVYDSTVHPVGTRFKELPIRVIHRESALYVDVFVYLDSKDDDGNPMTGPLPSWCYINCNHCPEIEDAGKEFKVPRDWIYPLRDCEFANRTLKCPAKSHEYLEYMFGKGYMTPVVFPY
jgi:hypothetical protein